MRLITTFEGLVDPEPFEQGGVAAIARKRGLHGGIGKSWHDMGYGLEPPSASSVRPKP